MKILNLGFAIEVENNIWESLFEVKNVDKAYVAKARDIDGMYYFEEAYTLEVIYDSEKEVIVKCNLLYIAADQNEFRFDYALSKEQLEYVIGKVKIKINEEAAA